jgi:acetyltransferase-like isoleucine patch superfamily enzyme
VKFILGNIVDKLYFSVWKLKNRRKFKFFGVGSSIKRSIRFKNPENIVIGDRVRIGYKTWLSCTNQTGYQNPELIIGSDTYVGNFNHIYATKKIEIGSNVLIADKVYISDNQHTYEDINIPIKRQPLKQLSPVSIGDGSWIGENVCIVGATIGKNCVIGANSVVTKNIPDFCVAVGIPARIIKRYDLNKCAWIRI